ncbi:hypothetical protein CWE09_03335 [Aliidiomarina minuta]|uniref:HTH tetR-type domain-containing protein n=1 Tax=Aliidiomarina minuta TaxID=880057 RepID=A0A432W6T2_9GAMM|nr:helix-turn-helix domain-containing protein [Aliidiomarina minuta]RUO25777.1 hypothetical protein CWE09_03335 [Aliidiomarina minuta]
MEIKKTVGRPSSRHFILMQGLQLAAEEGVKGFTMEALVNKANLTKGGLLYHFKGMSDLVWQMLVFYYRESVKNHFLESTELESVSFEQLIAVIDSMPVEANVESLFIKHALENETFRERLIAAFKRQNIATNDGLVDLYAAVGHRVIKVYGILDEELLEYA